jgi:hypothetical protein
MLMHWELWAKIPHQEKNQNFREFCMFYLFFVFFVFPIKMIFSEQRVSALLMSILTGLSVFFTHILGVCIWKLPYYLLSNLFSIYQCLFFMVFLCIWVFLHYEICKLVNLNMFFFVLFEILIFSSIDIWSCFIIFYATKTSTRLSIFTTCANNTCSFIYSHTNSCTCGHVCSKKFQIHCNYFSFIGKINKIKFQINYLFIY